MRHVVQRKSTGVQMAKKRKQIEGHQLYCYSACLYCIVVRLELWRLGLKIPLKDILTQPGNSADLVAGGGKSQVPCLRVESEGGDVRWIYETTEIIHYLKTELVV
jgi:glutathione S-transferase